MGSEQESRIGSGGGLSLPRPLGAYLLLEEIGRGGNGVVFKARQPVLNRLCAVKMLLGGEFAGPDAEARLRTEAAAAASLDHPHIVGIYEAGLEDGLLYFSMEYVPGQTLNQLVRATLLPAEKIARYVRDIARAIDYAHSRGVLHRDLKPTNVIIDANDQVQITDFGLTKGVHEADHTTDGAGSPNFMAPEQASAAFGQTGVRTDVFGIGAILYFLLTDRPPFRCETLAATLQAVIHSDPKRPRDFRTGVPRDLETICMKCLEKRPARRYATAAEVADELDRFLRDEPILAHPVGPLERGFRWCRRHPALAGFATATTVLMLTLAVGGPAMALRLRHQRDFTRRNLYAADMAAAFQALEGGGERQVHEMLDRYRPENQDGLDLRGWEWFHLAHRTRDRSVALIGTNEATPTVLRLLPDGKRVLVSDFGGRLALWELASRKKLWSRVVRTNASSMFVVSPDGRLACVIDRHEGSTNTLVRVLEADSGALVAEYQTTGLATPFAVSPDGSLWLQAGRELRRLGIRDGRPVGSLLLRTNATDLSVSLSPDGRWIAAALDGNELQILPAEQQGPSHIAREIHRPGPIGAGAVAVAFSPDSRRIATCGRDGSVGIWTVPEAKLVVRLLAHPDLVVAADFSEDGSRIVTGGRDSAIRVWSVPDGRLVSEQTGQHSLLRYAVVLPGSREFVTTADDNAIRLWNLQPEAEQTIFTNIPARVVAVGLIPDGKHYGWARADGTGGFAEIATGKTFMTGGTDEGTQVTGAAAASPDGRVLMVRLLADGRVQLASIEKGPLTQWRIPNWSFAGQGQGGQVQLDISRDLRHLAVADPVQGIGVFEAQTGRPVGRFQSPGFIAIALAPKELRVAHSGRVGGPRIRDLVTGVDLEMKAEAGFRQNIAFSPEGRYLLTAGLDGVVHVFDSTTGALVQRLTSRATGLIYVAASPDGSRVAAGSVDGGVSLWDMQTGRAIGMLTGHRSPVGSLEFLADGRLVTGASDSIRFWAAPGWVGSR